CHGLGLGLHERPLISRVNSLREPIELKAGMVFAVETYCPASDGISAARIEEEVILTPTGAKIISLYPAEGPPIATPYKTIPWLDRPRPHGLRLGRAPGQGRLRPRGLDPHRREVQAARE